MKKLLVVLLALSVFGMFAFAEDAAAPAPVPTITSWARYQVTLIDKDGQQYLGPDWGQIGAGNFIDLSLTYDAKTYGVNGTLEYGADALNGILTYAQSAEDANGDTTDLTTVASDGTTQKIIAALSSPVRDYTAWVKPFDNYLKVGIGKLRNGDYRIASYIDGTGFNNRIAGFGYTVQVYPVDGASLGLFTPVTNSATDYSVSNLGFGGSYAIPDIATIKAQYLGAKKELFVGADVKAVKDVTILAGYTYDSDDAFSKIWLSGGTSLLESKLGLGLDSYYKIATPNEAFAKVNASYSLGKITPSANVSVTYNDSLSVGYEGWLSFSAGGAALNVGVTGDIDGALAVPMYVDISF